MNRHHADVTRRAGKRCEYCRAPATISNFPFEIDHIIPVSASGDDELANLALACRSCNLYKSATREGQDESGNQVPLFNPRIDRWNEHFAWDLDRGEVVGLTPTGHVTIEALQMNSPNQIMARLVWIEYRLFP